MKGMISMLNKNYKILCNINLTHENITVNDIIQQIQTSLKNTPSQLIGCILNDVQKSILDKYMGKKWNEFKNKSVPWICPHCLERSSFVRRGSRARKLKSSSGTIEFNLFQVTCSSCTKTFSPFPQVLGLKPRARTSSEFEEKILSIVLNNSYSKTSDTIDLLTNESISHTSIHSLVSRASNLMNLEHKQSHFKEVIVDSTKVKTAHSSRGSDIQLVLAPMTKTVRYNRVINNKKLLYIGVNKSLKSMNRNLSKYTCENVITDGDKAYNALTSDVFEKATHRRCLWHLPRTLNHLLYMEGIPGNERKCFSQALIGILKERDFSKSRNEYVKFTYLFKRIGMTSIENFLKNAFNGIFYNEEDWINTKVNRSNSLIEREMREINRRTDVGCRWSDEGCENLIKLIQIKKYATHCWDTYFKQNKRPVKQFSQVTLCF